MALVRAQTGLGNMAYLAELGLASPRLCAAHCVWVDDAEQAVMAERGVQVLHCPGSNLKLGSGVAPVVAMRARGIGVSLGADGAACNNRLDMFDEMRLAATLQAERQGPGSLTARDVLVMATRGGAAALGLEAEIGSIEPGKRADLIVVEADAPHLAPGDGSLVDAGLRGPRDRRPLDHRRRRDPRRSGRSGRAGRPGHPRRSPPRRPHAHEPRGPAIIR